METITAWIEPVTKAMEVVGVFIVVIGALISTAYYLAHVRRDASVAYAQYRRHLARAILLGLEFLVAADIIQSVAVHPTLQSVGLLGLIVVIRSFLSISIEMEVEGRWPWQRRNTGTADEPRTT